MTGLITSDLSWTGSASNDSKIHKQGIWSAVDNSISAIVDRAGLIMKFLLAQRASNGSQVNERLCSLENP